MLQHDKRCPSNLILVREKRSCLQELFDRFIIRAPSPLKRTEGSSLLIKTRQSSSSPKKTNEREESSSTSSPARNELLCPFWVREEIPLQVLYRSISKKQRDPSNSTRRTRAPSASWSTIRESRAPGRPRFLFKREERQLSRSEDRAPVTFKRRDWSSPQPSTRHEQPCPLPLKQEQRVPGSYFWQKDFLYFLLSPHFI